MAEGDPSEANPGSRLFVLEVQDLPTPSRARGKRSVRRHKGPGASGCREPRRSVDPSRPLERGVTTCGSSRRIMIAVAITILALLLRCRRDRRSTVLCTLITIFQEDGPSTIFWGLRVLRREFPERAITIQQIEDDADYDEFPAWLNADTDREAWRTYMRLRTAAVARVHVLPIITQANLAGGWHPW